MRNNNIFGLPTASVNLLSVGFVFFIGCLGIRVIRASDIALKVANTQLVTSSSADRLEQLANRLEEQAEIIKQKDEAYQQLQYAYNEYLEHRKGDIELGEKIEAIEALPEVENIEEIQVEIQETEEDLLEIRSD